jgi:hypothetical protein
MGLQQTRDAGVNGEETLEVAQFDLAAVRCAGEIPCPAGENAGLRDDAEGRDRGKFQIKHYGDSLPANRAVAGQTDTFMRS